MLPRPHGVLSERDDLVVVQNEIAEYTSAPMNQIDNTSEPLNKSFEVAVNGKQGTQNQTTSVAKAKQILRQ